MERIRAFFNTNYGVEATGFTVIVGANRESMLALYERTTGRTLRRQNRLVGWVTRMNDGEAVLGILLGQHELNESSPRGAMRLMPHEYFHVLQGYLTAQPEWGLHHRGPNWLVEGTALYAHTQFAPDAFAGHDSPWLDLAFEQAKGNPALSGDLVLALEGIESYADFHSAEWYAYPLSNLAVTFLSQQAESDAFVRYWSLLGQRATWREAFVDAFNISITDFYAAFDQWAKSTESPVPKMVQLKFQLLWPGGGPAGFSVSDTFPKWQTDVPYVRYSSNLKEGTVAILYPEGAKGAGRIALSWYADRGIEYALGWYKDGGLTTNEQEATVFQFTGMPEVIEWNLPKHPSQLPHLKCHGYACP